eukprot:3919378-Alexandrium_andersonii.AAC.1
MTARHYGRSECSGSAFPYLYSPACSSDRRGSAHRVLLLSSVPLLASGTTGMTQQSGVQQTCVGQWQHRVGAEQAEQ